MTKGVPVLTRAGERTDRLGKNDGLILAGALALLGLYSTHTIWDKTIPVTILCFC